MSLPPISPRLNDGTVASTRTSGAPPSLVNSTVPVALPSISSSASAASAPMSGRSSDTEPIGTNASSSSRSPSIRFLPSDTRRLSISRLPSTLRSVAAPFSSWPEIVPESVTSAAGLSRSARPLADSSRPSMVRPPVSIRSLVTVSVRSGRKVSPLAFTVKATCPAEPGSSLARSVKPPVISASISCGPTVALAVAERSPEVRTRSSTPIPVSAERVIVPFRPTRSASAICTASGSTPRAMSASIATFSVDPSRAAVPESLASSVPVFTFPWRIVALSTSRSSSNRASTPPARTRASVSFSVPIAAAETSSVTGPASPARSKPSECTLALAPSITAKLLPMRAASTTPSTIGSVPAPNARSARRSKAIDIASSPRSSLSGTGPERAFASRLMSVAPFGSVSPAAVAAIAAD